MIVAKFGGTSVADPSAIRRLVAIARRDSSTAVVVVSAMSGVTDALIACARAAAAGGAADAGRTLGVIADRHHQAAAALGLDRDARAAVAAEFDEAAAVLQRAASARDASAATLDRVLATGELASSRLIAAALRAAGLGAVWVDARDVMVTDSRHGAATPLQADIRRQLAVHVWPHVSRGERVVLGGFVGATAGGSTTTLGRGGSDYSASLVGAALDAGRVDIWTDVDGLLTADPRLVEAPHVIEHVSFAEASELAYFGAKVLHPSTLLPAMANGTPVRIRSARSPDGAGTLITATALPSATPLRGLAAKRGVTIVSIASTRMLDAHGFLRRVFEVFDRHRAVVDVVTTSEVSISVTLDDTSALASIEADLRPIADVVPTTGVALLCAVGERLKTDTWLCPAVLETLRGMPIHMVSQAAGRQNLTVLLDDGDLATAMRRLHERFCREGAGAGAASRQAGLESAALEARS